VCHDPRSFRQPSPKSSQACWPDCPQVSLRRDTVDNYGGYMLIDPWHNTAVAGSRFDLTAADVVEWCME